MDALVERRIFDRIQEDFSGWYTLKDEKDILGEFLGLDASAGGIRVNSRKEILEGRALVLSLALPLVSAPIQMAAQVAWQRELRPGWFQSGLKFFQPDLTSLWPLIRPDHYSQE